MKRAGRLVEQWTVPKWALGKDTLPPPAILLQCSEMCPAGEDSELHAISSEDDFINEKDTPLSKSYDIILSVDYFRKSPLLGWNNYEQCAELIKGVLDIPGHHFNVFWEENVSSLNRLPSKVPQKILEPVLTDNIVGGRNQANETGMPDARITAFSTAWTPNHMKQLYNHS